MTAPGSRRIEAFLVHGILIAVSVAALYPVLWVFKMAFSPGRSFSLGLNPFPSDFSLEHFERLLGSRGPDGGWLFGQQMLNSLVVSLATTLVGILLATTAAYAFSRFRFPGRNFTLSGFLVTQMFPGTMLLIPLYVLLDRMGLLDHLLGLVLVYATTALPFCVYMLKGYFDTIPTSLEEAALLDGASRARIFWSIVLPLSRPAIAVTALFSFMTAWNEFILAATFMAEESSYTLPVVLRDYVGSKSKDWGAFAAGALCVSTPVVALFMALQKHLVAGLTKGAVKG